MDTLTCNSSTAFGLGSPFVDTPTNQEQTEVYGGYTLNTSHGSGWHGWHGPGQKLFSEIQTTGGELHFHVMCSECHPSFPNSEPKNAPLAHADGSPRPSKDHVRPSCFVGGFGHGCAMSGHHAFGQFFFHTVLENTADENTCSV